MLALAGAAWAGAGLGRWVGWWVLLVVIAGLGGMWFGRRRLAVTTSRTAVGVLLVLAAAGTVTVLRLDQVDRSPVGVLAQDGAVVRVVGTVRSDPRRVSARYGDLVVTRLELRQVTGRGSS